jgi:hypothetical protein
MKRSRDDFDREKKLKKIVKGTDKAVKHRKSLYNMLSSDEDDLDDDTGEVGKHYGYHGNNNYTKQR